MKKRLLVPFMESKSIKIALMFLISSLQIASWFLPEQRLTKLLPSLIASKNYLSSLAKRSTYPNPPSFSAKIVAPPQFPLFRIFSIFAKSHPRPSILGSPSFFIGIKKLLSIISNKIFCLKSLVGKQNSCLKLPALLSLKPWLMQFLVTPCHFSFSPKIFAMIWSLI
jgi:hypothetical protein